MARRDITLADIKGRCKLDLNTECWVWSNCCDDAGNARIRTKGKSWYVRRLAYQLAHGELPARRDICPSCGDKACCNPKHLIAMTRRQHQRAVEELGRASSGARHSVATLGPRRLRAKLSMEKAREIRAQAGISSTASLAERFGVSEANIVLVIKGRTWRETTPFSALGLSV